MSKLRDLIVEMIGVHRTLGAMALEAQTDATRRPDLIRLRKRAAQAVQVVIAAIDDDGQLKEDPDLALEVRRQFSEVRSRIAIFQAKWPAVLLNPDDEGFISDRKELREKNDAVTNWALRVLT